MHEKVSKSRLFKDKKIEIIPLPIDQNFWKPVNKYHARELLEIDEKQNL